MSASKGTGLLCAIFMSAGLLLVTGGVAAAAPNNNNSAKLRSAVTLEGGSGAPSGVPGDRDDVGRQPLRRPGGA